MAGEVSLNPPAPLPGSAEMLSSLFSARRSVRGYRPDTVDRELLLRIFAQAQSAPSNCNVQPWVVHVVSGAAANRVSDALFAAASGGAPISPDFPLTGAYSGIWRDRQIEAAKTLFAATGVARHDIAARTSSMLRNFSFFGAPHAAFLLMPEWAGYREAVDCGIYAQSLMLSLTAHGLASCAQGALSHYANVVHEQLGIGPDLRLLIGIAFGYPDDSHPANRTATTRVPVEDAVCFHD